MSNTIIIVDDHNLFAQSLKGLVNSFQHFEVVAVLKTDRNWLNTLKQIKKTRYCSSRYPNAANERYRNYVLAL